MFNRARRIIPSHPHRASLSRAALIAVFGLWRALHGRSMDTRRTGPRAGRQHRPSGGRPDHRVATSADNQFVHKGDLLYVIDKVDYKIALDMANAEVASKKADLDVKKQQNLRRQELTTLSTSVEEKQQFAGSYEVAQGAYQTALANLEKAKVNLQRTDVRSTVNGYVTNLLMRVGDYANTGRTNISIVDSDSYWVAGYFEETKMGSFRVGDPATIDLMGYREPIAGHVQSITRGIATSNATVSTQGLPSVQAVYTWVRLAQRIPVRIQIDKVPADITLSAGMSATVIVHPEAAKHRDVWNDIRAQFADLFQRS